MGWTSYHRKPSDPKAELIRLLEGGVEGGPTFKVMHTSQRSNIFYFAVKITPAKIEGHSYGHYTPYTDGSYTIGVVAETKVYNGDWGYKFIEETQGPQLSDAPIKLINMLSDLPLFPDDDTGAKYASDWRARCISNTRTRSKRQLANGDVIQFKSQITFSTPEVGKNRTFRVSKESFWGGRSKTVFICQDTNTRCRITGFSRLAYDTLTKAEAHA